MWSVVNGHIRFDAPFWPQTDAVGLNAKFKRIRRTGKRNKTEIELYKKTLISNRYKFNGHNHYFFTIYKICSYWKTEIIKVALKL